jgi:hypothetical protein
MRKVVIVETASAEKLSSFLMDNVSKVSELNPLEASILDGVVAAVEKHKLGNVTGVKLNAIAIASGLLTLSKNIKTALKDYDEGSVESAAPAEKKTEPKEKEEKPAKPKESDDSDEEVEVEDDTEDESADEDSAESDDEDAEEESDSEESSGQPVKLGHRRTIIKVATASVSEKQYDAFYNGVREVLGAMNPSMLTSRIEDSIERWLDSNLNDNKAEAVIDAALHKSPLKTTAREYFNKVAR